MGSKVPRTAFPLEKHLSKLQITANKMQVFLNLFIFADNLNISGGFPTRHQEHITVHTASGIVNQYCC
jgi:hypothetical protein